MKPYIIVNDVRGIVAKASNEKSAIRQAIKAAKTFGRPANAWFVKGSDCRLVYSA
jgi:hypothetical protein